ncbi:hypothetical protein LCGC14_2580440 [marine sediment metagenome]|uniref:Uncharacterized protein n=1 Tax=marine sediment metagenome TaxID=412755 RepID=A0A0F9D7B8_9ZZZZ
MPTYTTIVDLCGGCGYVLPELMGLQEECLCPDCGKDVKLFRDRVGVVVRDADLGEFTRLVNARRREGGVFLNEAEKKRLKENYELAKENK